MVQSGQSLTVFLSVARHRTSPPSFRSPPWHCQSVSGAFAVFHFALSFSCWENYLPSRQFLARAEHRKVKYFSVFGKRTSGGRAAGGSVERRGRVHLNVAHVKWNIFQ